MKLLKYQDCREYVANPEAFCSARLDELAEGNGRGSRIIQVANGSGLEFTITPDRAMDLVECRFRGIPLVFRSPVGYAHPARYEATGCLWLRNWPAGLMTTSGLRNSGVPNGEFGLHGRASSEQAEEVGITRSPDGTHVTIRGVWREAAMFGENLRLERRITTGYLDDTITVEDTITNLGAKPDYLQLLYHCNFGYPFVSPDLRFETPKHEVVARDQHAADGLKEWNKMAKPDPNFVEQCYFHDLPMDKQGMRHFIVSNPVIGTRLEISFSGAELPNFVQWKNCLARMYVLGLEPCNVSLRGREQDIKDKIARKLERDETIHTMVKFSFTAI